MSIFATNFNQLNMKKVLSFITLCFIVISVNAQNEVLIHKSNGETTTFNTSEIDSITFETTDKMFIHQSNGETTNINRSDIDSIRFA